METKKWPVRGSGTKGRLPSQTQLLPGCCCCWSCWRWRCCITGDEFDVLRWWCGEAAVGPNGDRGRAPPPADDSRPLLRLLQLLLPLLLPLLGKPFFKNYESINTSTYINFITNIVPVQRDEPWLAKLQHYWFRQIGLPLYIHCFVISRTMCI